jgi:uncharacterized membrane protein YhaH (DUF805 family)
MGFVEAVKSALSKYATFSGRARRAEYWWFTLFSLLAVLAAVALDVALGISEEYNVLSTLVVLALILPGISVAVRRLHDTGRSGGWYFISFIPIIGPIWLLVLLLQDSKPLDNHYGASPKYGSQTQEQFHTPPVTYS